MAAAVAAVLAACGGGSNNSGPSGPGETYGPLPGDTEAVRFLTQSTFGPTQGDVNALKEQGYVNWINGQFAVPRTAHMEYILAKSPLPTPAGASVTIDPLYHSFWRQALTAPDQLRQRVAFALSQILVISAADTQLVNSPHTIGSYLDGLSEHAFGNYRDLLQFVTLHPAMGQYLTSLQNRGDLLNGVERIPDENYAREVMQLFTIGLFETEMDGTLRMDPNDPTRPLENYDMEDIRNLAKVFTGWSWGNQGPPDPCNARFSGGGCNGGTADVLRRIIPMQHYAQYHSPSEKRFLSAVIPAGTPGPQALNTALDTLFAHPNLPPFIARQFIQRMVTSNPSPAYIRAVSCAFAEGRYPHRGGVVAGCAAPASLPAYSFGSGRRGDMRALVAATLLDPEARALALTDPGYGKLREPVLRLSSMLRAFEVTTTDPNGDYRIGDLDNNLFQTPMKAPSVFNFFRPGYVPPNTTLSAQGKVGPEFQIVQEVSVATYANSMQTWLNNGGLGTAITGAPANPVRPQFTTAMSLAADPERLADHLNLLMTYNTMDTASRNAIRDAIASVPTSNTNMALNRVKLGLYLTMVSPTFLVQK